MTKLQEKEILLHCLNLNTQLLFPVGTSLREIAAALRSQLGFEPLNCQVNNLTTPLSNRLYEPAQLRFVGISEESGMRTYVRTLSFVMSCALHRVLPESELTVQHSLSHGYYCSIKNGQKGLTSQQLTQLKQEIDALIARDLPFEEHTAPAEEVIKLFQDVGRSDKAELLKTAGKLYYTYYTLDGYPDSYYGSLTPSTGYLYLYDLIPMPGGILMRVPDRKNPSQLPPLTPQPMMHQVFAAQDKLLDILEIGEIGSLNTAIKNGRIAELIRVSEAVQEKEIASIATQIAERYEQGIRLVLISGPSSSGKTTFTKRLSTQLVTHFLKPHALSLDDYFSNRDQTPRDEDGEYDFESLYALDLPLFNEQLTQLIQGQTVSLPTYDFHSGKRVYKGRTLKLNPGDLLVLEGIHALNPELVSQIPSDSIYRIYVSALTAVGLDKHNRIPSTDNRLIRRVVRDYRYRNHSAIETLKRWPSVRKGEDKWVFPYQENADAMFNSAMVYELAALRLYVEPILREVPPNVPEYCEAQRLLRFFELIHYIPVRMLPSISLLREFVGGSSFRY